MNENALKACMIGLMGLSLVVSGVLIGLGHNSAIQDAFLAIIGGVGSLSLWERLKKGS